MDYIEPSKLKSILHSKRANLYYLEHCRVLANGGRVEYITNEGKRALYWNIPIANTTCLLLGSGTSITQAAMRELAKAGVMVGFCGGNGTPLFAGNEAKQAVNWLTPQSEYRPTQYLQAWVSFWFDSQKRLAVARQFQQVRYAQIARHWRELQVRYPQKFLLNGDQLERLLTQTKANLEKCTDTAGLLAQEALTSKTLYRLAAQACRYGEFTRAKHGTGKDSANRLLDHGNYLAYGLAATACWVLGLPHGLAVLHGKTRRGALVFDVADLIKDAIVLPQAFLSAIQGDDASSFRQTLTTRLQECEALDVMVATLEQVALSMSKQPENSNEYPIGF